VIYLFCEFSSSSSQTCSPGFVQQTVLKFIHCSKIESLSMQLIDRMPDR